MRLEDELKRRARISDMMASAHSILRDRYRRRAIALDALILTGSVVLAALTFVDPVLVHWLRFSDNAARLVIGLTALFVFLLSLISPLVKWKQASARHGQAVGALADIKNRCREILTAGVVGRVDETAEFLRAASVATASLLPIPDARFTALKALHKRKVEISQLLDQYPWTPRWLIGLRLRARDMRAFLAAQRQPAARLGSPVSPDEHDEQSGGDR